MKTIRKTENVIEENPEKDEKDMKQDVTVIYPHKGYNGLVSEVVEFLAERTAERFDSIIKFPQQAKTKR